MKAKKEYQKLASRIIQPKQKVNITFADNRKKSSIASNMYKTMQFVGGYIPGNVNGPYAAIGNNQATPGANFSATQKNNIFQSNQAGAAPINVLYRDDVTGNALGDYTQVAAIDHIYPKGLGGINAYKNAQVIDAHTNSAIGNTYPKHGYTNTRLYLGNPWIRNIGGVIYQLPMGTILPIAGAGAGANIVTPWGNLTLFQARLYGLLGTFHNPL